jgi:hypothetical protein
MRIDDGMEKQDELIERVVGALAPLPAANAAATARVMAAVRAQKGRAPSRLVLAFEWMRQPTLSVASASFLAAAALVVGFVTRGALKALGDSSRDMTSTAETPVAKGPAPVQAVARDPNAVSAVKVPLVFEGADARSVAVVGDFNGWDPSSSPMKRYGAGGPWTITVTARPGRHTYAFMVDGKLVLDPRAPRTRDLDYGGEASVLMVTAP